MNRVLVIDNDLVTCREIKYNLKDDLTDLYYTRSVEEAIHKMQKENYSLIIMDVCLSQVGGTVLIQQIRQMTPMPILALSETTSMADKVAALKCGADDFLSKPFDLEECLARAQALMRRYTLLNHVTGRNYALVSHEDLMLDTAKRQVSIGNEKVILARKEYDILLHFLKNRNRVLTFEQIYNAIWNEEYLMGHAAIFYHVGNLRRKLRANKRRGNSSPPASPAFQRLPCQSRQTALS